MWDTVLCNSFADSCLNDGGPCRTVVWCCFSVGPVGNSWWLEAACCDSCATHVRNTLGGPSCRTLFGVSLAFGELFCYIVGCHSVGCCRGHLYPAENKWWEPAIASTSQAMNKNATVWPGLTLRVTSQRAPRAALAMSWFTSQNMYEHVRCRLPFVLCPKFVLLYDVRIVMALSLLCLVFPIASQVCLHTYLTYLSPCLMWALPLLSCPKFPACFPLGSADALLLLFLPACFFFCRCSSVLRVCLLTCVLRRKATCYLGCVLFWMRVLASGVWPSSDFINILWLAYLIFLFRAWHGIHQTPPSELSNKPVFTPLRIVWGKRILPTWQAVNTPRLETQQKKIRIVGETCQCKCWMYSKHCSGDLEESQHILIAADKVLFKHVRIICIFM